LAQESLRLLRIQAVRDLRQVDAANRALSRIVKEHQQRWLSVRLTELMLKLAQPPLAMAFTGASAHRPRWYENLELDAAHYLPVAIVITDRDTEA